MNPNDQDNMTQPTTEQPQTQPQNTTPTTPLPTPTPPPEMPMPTPIPTPTPTPTPTPPPDIMSSHNPVQQKKKLPLVLIILVTLLVLIIGSILAWVFVYSPSVQSKKASNSFMKAATTGDKTSLVKLGDVGNDESAKAFLEKSSESVLGSFVLKQSTNKDSKAYYLYDLTNSTNKHARTTVEKKKGKWIVTSFVFGKDTLALIPGNSSNSPAKDQSSNPASPTSQTACLADSDLTSLNDARPEDKGFGTDFEIDGYRKYVGQTYFFQPDSTSFVYADQAKTALDKAKTFYDANKTKEFTIHLSGKVQESSSSSAGVKLAHDRAAKITSELISRGIAANIIVEDQPQPNSATYNDGSERNVDLDIHKKIPCTTTIGR